MKGLDRYKVHTTVYKEVNAYLIKKDSLGLFGEYEYHQKKKNHLDSDSDNNTKKRKT